MFAALAVRVAGQRADRAVASELSGTGSDGWRGVAAVNADSGSVFVQQSVDARFDGKPRKRRGSCRCGLRPTP
jgi:two-component system CheB/CheR fusion protein